MVEGSNDSLQHANKEFYPNSLEIIPLPKSFEKLDVPFAWICVLKPDIRLYGLVFYLLKLQQSASSRAPVKSLR